MIRGYEALDLAKRKPAVDRTRYPYDNRGDAVGIAGATPWNTRTILVCGRHNRGDAVTSELNGAVGGAANCRERAGRVSRCNRRNSLRRKSYRIRRRDFCAWTYIAGAAVGKGRLQLRRHHTPNHCSYSPSAYPMHYS